MTGVRSWLLARAHPTRKITMEGLNLGFRGLTALLCNSFCQCKVNTHKKEVLIDMRLKGWELQRLHYDRCYENRQYAKNAVCCYRSYVASLSWFSFEISTKITRQAFESSKSIASGQMQIYAK